MRRLGPTVSKLARYRRQWMTLLKSNAPHHRPIERSDHLTEHNDFGSNPGALRMYTFAPSALAEPPALVVVLHGCTQSAATYDLGAGWSSLAERHGFVLLVPEQTAANNPKTCFNWFSPADAVRGRGEALSIRQMIEKTVQLYKIDRKRVFITGLSAGGAMTSAMLAVYPEVFAAGAIIAGLPYGAATNVQQAFESMFQGRSRSAREWGDFVRAASPHRGPWPRVSIWHGDADATVVPVNAEAIIRQWTNVHGIDTEAVADIVDGYPRKVWRLHGADAVESYTITGMAHGTPLATGSGEHHCGTAGPFLIEAGISSSRHIASFFGLTDAAQSRAADHSGVHEAERVELVPQNVEFVADERVEVLPPDTGDGESQYSSRPGPVDVMAVITKALASAGLMKPT